MPLQEEVLEHISTGPSEFIATKWSKMPRFLILIIRWNFDIEKIRSLFPCTSSELHWPSLDNFDRMQQLPEPQSVLDALTDITIMNNSNISPRCHIALADRETRLFLKENPLRTIQGFSFTQGKLRDHFHQGTTESINLVASNFWQKIHWKGATSISFSTMRHHSNIVSLGKCSVQEKEQYPKIHVL